MNNDVELKELHRKPPQRKNTAAANQIDQDDETRAKIILQIRSRLWYRVTVRINQLWTKRSLETSRASVENTVVPLFMHYGNPSLLPDKSTMKEVLGMSSGDSNKPPTSTWKSQSQNAIPLNHRKQQLFDQMLPLALACSSLTAFILPLYDGPTITVLRWIMTLVSVFIGPRLSDGVYPAIGVLILGFMINKPLTICTVALGAWASFFLCVVISRGLGMYNELIDG